LRDIHAAYQDLDNDGLDDRIIGTLDTGGAGVRGLQEVVDWKTGTPLVYASTGDGLKVLDVGIEPQGYRLLLTLQDGPGAGGRTMLTTGIDPWTITKGKPLGAGRGVS
jgi:hypothetical protein